MKRVFVALNIPESVRDHVAEYVTQLQKLATPAVRWVPPQNLHLTLQFVGNVDLNGLAELEMKVEALATQTAPFQVHITGTGAFVTRHSRSNFLWLGVTSNNLNGATGVIDSMMAHLFPDGDRAARRLKPHLTIARLKDAGAAKNLIEAHLAGNFGPYSFEAEEIVIYESTLTPKGPIYTALSKHRSAA